MTRKHLDVVDVMKVAAGPGGVTEAGLNFIRDSLPKVFSSLVEVMDLRGKKRTMDLKT